MSRGCTHSCRRHRALTLVECLVASLLLALGASAVMVAISAGLQHQKYSSEERTAVELGRRLLEHVTALAYIDPNDPNYEQLAPSGAQGMNGYTDTVNRAGEPATGGGTYSRALQVTTATGAGVSGVPGVGLATVEVTSPSGAMLRLRQILPVQ